MIVNYIDTFPLIKLCLVKWQPILEQH